MKERSKIFFCLNNKSFYMLVFLEEHFNHYMIQTIYITINNSNKRFLQQCKTLFAKTWWCIQDKDIVRTFTMLVLQFSNFKSIAFFKILLTKNVKNLTKYKNLTKHNFVNVDFITTMILHTILSIIYCLLQQNVSAISITNRHLYS